MDMPNLRVNGYRASVLNSCWTFSVFASPILRCFASDSHSHYQACTSLNLLGTLLAAFNPYNGSWIKQPRNRTYRYPKRTKAKGSCSSGSP